MRKMIVKSRNALALAVLTAFLCLALIGGATFALFSSRSVYDIVVTSGNIDLSASVTGLKTYSVEADPNGELVDENGARYSWTDDLCGKFSNGGSAAVEEQPGKVVLDKMTPGDKAEFTIEIANNSNIAFKWQTSISVASDDGLYNGLEVVIDGEVYDGLTAKTEWTAAAEGDEIAPVQVSVSLPLDAGSEYLNKKATVQVFVSAVQGNAVTEDAAEQTVELYTAHDLRTFASLVNTGNSYAGYTVILKDDIDLGGEPFTPIGKKDTPFEGTFDGNGKTISNLVIVDESQTAYTGLFGYIETPALIKDVHIHNADVKGLECVGVLLGGWRGTVTDCRITGLIRVEGNYKVGGIAGDVYTVITDCSVQGDAGSYVKGVYCKSKLEGDNVGGAIGYTGEGEKAFSVSVSGIAVKGTRKVGGAVGYLQESVSIDASVSDCTVTIVDQGDYSVLNESCLFVGGIVGEYAQGCGSVTGFVKNVNIYAYNPATAGYTVGGTRAADKTIVNTATAENVAVLSEEDGLVLVTESDGSTHYEIGTAEGLETFRDNVNNKIAYKNAKVLLTEDITLTENWKPIYSWSGILNGTTIDGQGHTISGMRVEGGSEGGFISSNASSLTIKNITFKNAYVETESGNQKYAGVVIGKNYSPVTIEGVNVSDGKVINTWQCGGFVGFAEENAPVFRNCTIEDSFVGGTNATAGTFFGLGVVDVSLYGCKANNVRLYTDSEGENFYVGYLYGKTLTLDAECSETNVTVVDDYEE